MTKPGELIARGRSADIYDAGDGRVLRRKRSGPIPTAETDVMAAVERAGYPVPKVYSVDGSDMVMERVDGIDLLSRLTTRPWEARRIGSTLADLHRRLSAIPLDDITDGPSVGPGYGPSESYVHGDLHPGNVLLTGLGPVVIDWEGAGIGARDADVATTWLLLETAEADDVPLVIRPFVGLVRRALLRAFLRGVEEVRPETVAAVCELRLNDANMRPAELAAIRAFAQRHST